MDSVTAYGGAFCVSGLGRAREGAGGLGVSGFCLCSLAVPGFSRCASWVCRLFLFGSINLNLNL